MTIRTKARGTQAATTKSREAKSREQVGTATRKRATAAAKIPATTTPATRPGAATAKKSRGSKRTNSVAPVVKTAGRPNNHQTVETRLGGRLLEIGDLNYAAAILGWDQATYMPPGGAEARGRQSAMLSKLAHEKAVDPALGRLLDSLARDAGKLPADGDDASLIRVARRDFERAVRLPGDYVERASALSSASYDAWTKARPAGDFATVQPYLEKNVELSREYAGYFAPWQRITDPMIDEYDTGMTTASVEALFAAPRTGAARPGHLRSIGGRRRLPARRLQ
jgi:Carboxypeptidase Taq (M32) metallopeptidase